MAELKVKKSVTKKKLMRFVSTQEIIVQYSRHQMLM